MKMEAKEQTPSHQALSVKKSRGRRRGKKKSRSALRENGETSSIEPPASQRVDMTSQSDDLMTSQCAEVTSEATVCETCGIQTKNHAQLVAHLSSKRHARRRRELRILAALSNSTEITDTVNKETLAAQLARGTARLQAPATLKDSELPDCITKKCEGKIRQRVSYSCDLCSVQLTSLVKVQEHLGSQRHSATAEGRPPPDRTEQRLSARKAKTRAAVKQSWFW